MVRTRQRALAKLAIAALVVLITIGCVVTVYVVTEKYESIHDPVKKGDTFAVRCFLLRRADVNAKNGFATLCYIRIAFRGLRSSSCYGTATDTSDRRRRGSRSRARF